MGFNSGFKGLNEMNFITNFLLHVVYLLCSDLADLSVLSNSFYTTTKQYFLPFGTMPV